MVDPIDRCYSSNTLFAAKLMGTTSVKLPDELKARAARVAQARGVSVHAFLVDAIRREIDASERRAEFIADAVQAREHFRTSGKGYSSEDVHAYLRNKTRGQPAMPARPRAWRE